MTKSFCVSVYVRSVIKKFNFAMSKIFCRQVFVKGWSWWFQGGVRKWRKMRVAVALSHRVIF